MKTEVENSTAGTVSSPSLKIMYLLLTDELSVCFMRKQLNRTLHKGSEQFSIKCLLYFVK